MMLIKLTWLITCLIVHNIGASRLMSSLALFKAFACLVRDLLIMMDKSC
jgi:hypothetical protein